MTADTETWIMRELNKIHTTVEKTASDVVDVRERVTSIETKLKVIGAIITLIVPTLCAILLKVIH